MTRIVCHRGACRHAPENTIASGLAAAQLGGDIVELDVRQSLDGVLYVLHDATLDRTTNGQGLISQTHSGDLDQLDAGSWFGSEFSDERLPRLDAFLSALKDHVDFYIEVKLADVSAIGEAVIDAGLSKRCFAYSEDARMRDLLRTEVPWMKRMINWRDVAAISDAREIGASILEFHAPDLTMDRLAEARNLGLEIMVYTPELDEEIFRTAFAARIDYLNIDFPDIAARIRKETQ